MISKFIEGFGFLLCVIHIYCKYVLVISLKYKKSVTITIAFQKILDELGHKPNKIQVNKGGVYEIMVTPVMTQKCIQHITKENLLLRKDLLEP